MAPCMYQVIKYVQGGSSSLGRSITGIWHESACEMCCRRPSVDTVCMAMLRRVPGNFLGRCEDISLAFVTCPKLYN